MQARKGLTAAIAATVASIAMASVIAAGTLGEPGSAEASGPSAPTRLDPSDRGLTPPPNAADEPVPVALNLQGEIAGLAPGASATATVIVGDRTYPATVQGNAYTASIAVLNGDEMVVVEVASLRARYRSALGSAARLIAAAGSDGTVDSSERSSLRVSPFSSALAWMVRVGLGDRDAVSDAEFEHVTRSIVGTDLAVAAYLLDGWASGAIALPAGYQDGQQLLQNQAAYRPIAAQANWTAAMTYLFDQADNVPLTSLDQLPNALAMLGPVPLNESAMWVSDLQLLYRQTDGSYALYEDEPLTAHPRYTASLSAQGGVSLTPQGDAGSRNVLRYLPFPNVTAQLPVQRASRGHLLRRLVVGEVYDLWASRSVWQDSHHSAAGDYERENTEYSVWSAFDLGAASAANSWRPLFGSGSLSQPGPTYWLPAACNSTRRATHLPAFGKCAQSEHWFRFDSGGYGNGYQFNAATFGERMQYVAASGSRNLAFQVEPDGSLYVSALPTSQLPQVGTTFWRYEAGTSEFNGQDMSARLPVIYLARTTGGNFVGSSVAMTRQYDVALGSPVGTWRAPANQTWLARYPALDRTAEIRRLSDGSVRDATVYTVGGESIIPGQWLQASSGVADYQYRKKIPQTPALQYATDCQSAFATGATACAPSRVRYFQPLQRVGARLYGISDFYSNELLLPPGNTGPYDVRLLDTRADYIDCLSGDCQASVPPAAP
ncbi:hypothetical protein [Pseudomonas sp. CGJS7]|uniref:hypothetical protein n=1 Tax=Pseudomonas sp. CGJS7 TaxID=3109348 RepID=UPI0030085C18